MDSLIAHLGLAGVGAEELVGAMAAYGEASGKRFVLMIDALNEADHPQAWGKQLGEVRRLLRASPWTSLVVTCRSVYLHWLDSPGGGGHGMPEVVHPGFSGHEREAQDKFFEFYGVDAPAAPLVLPEFTNPLFLKLYCLGGADEPTAGASAIFEGFIAKRTERIDIDLDIDPHDDLVRQAVSGLARAMAEGGVERLPYEVGKRLIDAFLPGRTKFEETLFGRLLREGIISVSHAVLDGEWRRTVGFPYQRFSDHLIVSSLLDEHAAEVAGDQPFGPWAENLSPGLYAAMAIAVPERSGSELTDRLPSALAGEHRIARTQIASVARRRPDAVNKRTGEWLVERWEREDDRGRIAGVLTAVAPVEDHALNGHWLHEWLREQTLAERDRGWTWATYDLADAASSALTSLMTWAAGGPSERVGDTMLLLAVTPLMYALASPNRFLRDGATKALVGAMAGRPAAVARFLEKAYETNDGYVRERSCAVAYGCALRSTDADGTNPRWKTVCETAIPFIADVNVLTRDHVAGLCRWAVKMGIDGATELLDSASPPYGSDPPAEPPSEDDLKAALEAEGWMILSSSAFSKWSDFTRYEVQPVCDRIAFAVRQEEIPTESLLRTWSWRLTEDQRQTLRGQSREQQVEVFLQWLAANEDLKTRTVIDNPPVEFGMRWITQRCLDYGWTPELFDDIDRGIARYRGSHGREAAKPERFGKKYQWLSLFELAARWLDAYQLDSWEAEEGYAGAWQLWLRDLDPSLPLGEPIDAFDEAPPAPLLSEQGEWAWPPGPTFSENERDQAQWAQREDDLPDPVSCVQREHPDGTPWVVLGGYFNHADDPRKDTSLDRTDRSRREFGMLFTSRIVRSDEGEQVDGWLATKPDVLRRDPEWQAQAAGQVYLGEMPWAEAAAGRANEWHDADPGRHWPVTSARALSDYMWEGGVTHDCSLSSSVGCYCPGSILWESEDLTWDGRAGVWSSGTTKVLMAAEGPRGRLLLARNDWLAELLEKKGWIMVAGLFAERRVFVPGRPFENLETEGWVDHGAGVRLSTAGHVGHGWWTLRDRVTEAQEGEWPPGRDPAAEATDSDTNREATS
jgi:hypothetical protein